MLRRQVPEEDSTILINVAPGAENGDSYGSTARTSERSGGQEAAGRVGSPSEPQIDFVLVWEEDLRLGQPPDSAPRDKAATHAAWRDTFLENLRAAGLHVDQRHVHNALSAVHYVLLSAPWAVLCYHAEDLRLKLPLQALQELPNQASHWSARLLARLGIPNVLQEDVPDVPPEYYTCEFKVSKLSRYLGSDNPDTFFSSTDRHQILFAILAKTPYGHEKKGVIGIDQLLVDGVFSAGFPLHDGPFRPPPGAPQAAGLGRRQLLFQYWARWRKWSKYQPLEHVRGYFGEKVALYFAWLGFYTAWLLPAAAVGTLVFLVGCCMVSSDTPTQELCGSAEDLQMCPRCANCPFWPLSSACALAQVRPARRPSARLSPAPPQAGRLFDHGGTVFFSAFVALWAALLLAHWRRSSAALAHRWGCSHYEDLEERPRPQFAALAPTTAPNPVTGEDEPYFPRRLRVRPVLAGSVLVVMLVAVVVMCLVSVILCRGILAALVSRSSSAPVASWASRIASFTGSLVNLVFILVLSKIYVALARVLTRWEMHRTQTKFEDAFTLKVFIFQFVNFYSSPIYVAFFKGRFVGYPGNYHTLFGVRNEEAGPHLAPTPAQCPCARRVAPEPPAQVTDSWGLCAPWSHRLWSALHSPVRSLEDVWVAWAAPRHPYARPGGRGRRGEEGRVSAVVSGSGWQHGGGHRRGAGWTLGGPCPRAHRGPLRSARPGAASWSWRRSSWSSWWASRSSTTCRRSSSRSCRPGGTRPGCAAGGGGPGLPRTGPPGRPTTSCCPVGTCSRSTWKRCCSSASSPSSWPRAGWRCSSRCSTTGWRSAWTRASSCASSGARWPSARRTSASGRASWRSSRTWRWSATPSCWPSPPTSCRAPTIAGPTPTTCAASSTSRSRMPRPPSPWRTTARAGTRRSGKMMDSIPRPTGIFWPSAWPLSSCLSTWCSPSAGSSTSWSPTSPSPWRSK